jgi:hypothetical protein
VSVSRSAVLRLLDALRDPETPAPRVVGVDEYAMREGRVYGTVLVDVEARRPVDLLPEVLQLVGLDTLIPCHATTEQTLTRVSRPSPGSGLARAQLATRVPAGLGS